MLKDTPIEQLKKIVAMSNSISEILRILKQSSSGTSFRHLKKYLDKNGIDYSHIPMGQNSNKGRYFNRPKISLDTILVQHSTYSNTYNLKLRLFKEGILQPICSECGLGDIWNGKQLSLQLDHINGVSDDNRLDNLRILCPNCHTQTHTYAGRKLKLPPKSKNDKKIFIQPTKFPGKEILEKLIWEMPMVEIAKIYHVSDVAIKKWCKKYNIEKPPVGHWALKENKK